MTSIAFSETAARVNSGSTTDFCKEDQMYM